MQENTSRSGNDEKSCFVKMLAEEMHQLESNIERIYLQILSDLENTAGIKDYVSIFEWRRTREKLKLN